MDNKFIPKIPDKSVISIRLDNIIIEEIDRLSKRQKMSRNELIKQCIVFALERIDDSIDTKKLIN